MDCPQGCVFISQNICIDLFSKLLRFHVDKTKSKAISYVHEKQGMENGYSMKNTEQHYSN